MDELKIKKVMEEKMKKLVNGGLQLLKLVQKHPDLWSKDVMRDYRAMSYKITGDPDTFQPEVKGGWGICPEQLTKDIGSQLYSESEWKSSQIDNCTVPSQQWRFNAVDKDGTFVPLRVDIIRVLF